jgi:hypothetical protein
MTVTRTKGDIIVEDIKIGDIHYEFGYGMCIKCEVITLPVFDKEHGGWSWKSKRSNGEPIDYFVHPDYSHYGPNLYSYEAYSGCEMI